MLNLWFLTFLVHELLKTVSTDIQPKRHKRGKFHQTEVKSREKSKCSKEICVAELFFSSVLPLRFLLWPTTIHNYNS